MAMTPISNQRREGMKAWGLRSEARQLVHTMVRGAHASSRAPPGVSPSDVPGDTPGTACGTQALHGSQPDPVWPGNVHIRNHTEVHRAASAPSSKVCVDFTLP